MASDLIVPVVEVRNIRIHPNADMLSISEVLGYQMVTGLQEDPDGPLARFFIRGERDERGNRVPVPAVPKIDFTAPDAAMTVQTDDGERDVERVNYSFRYKEGDKADRLDLAEVLGYQVVTGKGRWKSGMLGVYFPADTLL